MPAPTPTHVLPKTQIYLNTLLLEIHKQLEQHKVAWLDFRLIRRPCVNGGYLHKFRRVLVKRGLAAEKIIRTKANSDHFNNNQVLVQLTEEGRAQAAKLLANAA